MVAIRIPLDAFVCEVSEHSLDRPTELLPAHGSALHDWDEPGSAKVAEAGVTLAWPFTR